MDHIGRCPFYIGVPQMDRHSLFHTVLGKLWTARTEGIIKGEGSFEGNPAHIQHAPFNYLQLCLSAVYGAGMIP